MGKAGSKVKKEIEKNVNKGYDKKHTWTIYFLIDIKVVYIVFYAYISIINLISSTANIEATEDRQSTVEFPITSNDTGYVTEISDAVLWNCRDHSVSAHYYKFLYWMLLITLTISLAAFIATKLSILCYVCYDQHGLKKLWRISKLKTEEDIPDEVLKNFKCSCRNICRVVIPCAVSILSIAGLMLSFLSYDLHLLSCIEGIPESSIHYYSEGNKTGRVDIDLPDRLLNFQLDAVIAVAVIIILIFGLAVTFYCISNCIIKDMKKKYQNGQN